MSKRTLVIQSASRMYVPEWIARCMRTVEYWAWSNQFDYLFIGDEFFNYVPRWIMERAPKHLYPQVDIARLYAIKEAFTQGYDTVVWADADFIVFDPDNLKLPDHSAFAVEYMLFNLKITDSSINNSFMVFQRDDQILDIYIRDSEKLLLETDVRAYTRCMIGPDLLVAMDHNNSLNVMQFTGLFTQDYLNTLSLLAEGKVTIPPRILTMYRRRYREPMVGANLCLSGRSFLDAAGQQQMDERMAGIVTYLLETKGEAINRTEYSK